MVELKVRKFGNSLGVVLPKEVISRLRTADGEALFLIEAPDGGYQLTPYDPSFEKRMAKAEDIMHRHRTTLQDLSKERSQSGSTNAMRSHCTIVCWRSTVELEVYGVAGCCNRPWA